MLSVDCRSAIPLHSAPRGWITVWEQSHPNIVTGQVLVSISAYAPHCVWLFAQIDSIIAENLKENRLICYRTVSGVNQGCLSSLICCRPVVNPGTQVGLLTAMQPKKEGWIQQLWGRAGSRGEGQSGFILHLSLSLSLNPTLFLFCVCVCVVLGAVHGHFDNCYKAL